MGDLAAAVRAVVVGIDALRADPAVPAAAVRPLDDARDLLVGRAGHERGVLPALAEGRLDAAFTALAGATRNLQRAAKHEPRALPLALALAVAARDLVATRLALLEAALGATDAAVTAVRSLLVDGIAHLDAGDYDAAVRSFGRAQDRIERADVAGPALVLVSPAARYLSSGAFVVEYHTSDALSAIDPFSVRLAIDGVDRTAEAAVDAYSTRLDLAALPLGEGDHVLTLLVRDRRGNLAERADSVGVDLESPIAEFTAPLADSVLGTRHPLAVLTYADPPGAGGFASGLDVSIDVRLLLDGADVTGDAEIGPTFAQFYPPMERPLAEGPHVLRGLVRDRSGREVETAVSFSVDTIPPVIDILSPAEGATLEPAAVVLEFSAVDANGVAAVEVQVDGAEVTGRFTQTGDGWLWQPTAGEAALAAGPHDWTVGATDIAGNRTETPRSYLVEEVGELPEVRIVLQLVDGDGQEGPIGRCVEAPPVGDTMVPMPGRPLVVRAVDANAANAPVASVPLRFEPQDPAGFVVEAPGHSTVTDEAGLAAVRYVLGRTVGAQTVRVTVLGDDSVDALDFTETGILPDFTVEMPYRVEPNILVGSGEAWIRTQLTRASSSGGRVRVDGTVRIEALDLAGNPLGDEPPGLFLNPRARPTNEYGKATFDVIPDEERSWRVRVTASDFPEVGERLYEVPGVTRAPRPAVLPMLSRTPLGQITTHDHEIAIDVDMSPMRIAMAGTREIFHVIILSESDEKGDPVYEFAPADKAGWSTRVYDVVQPDIPVFGAWVRPTEGTVATRPMPVLVILIYQLVDAATGAGRYITQRHERLAVGAPEVAFLKIQPDGRAVTCLDVALNRVFDSDWTPFPAASFEQYQVHLRWPKSPPEPAPAILESLDAARFPLADPRAVAAFDLPLSFAPAAEHSRYRVYTTAPFAATQDLTLPNQGLPETVGTGPALVQSVGGGTLEVDQVIAGRSSIPASAIMFMDGNGIRRKTLPILSLSARNTVPTQSVTRLVEFSRTHTEESIRAQLDTGLEVAEIELTRVGPGQYRSERLTLVSEEGDPSWVSALGLRPLRAASSADFTLQSRATGTDEGDQHLLPALAFWLLESDGTSVLETNARIAQKSIAQSLKALGFEPEAIDTRADDTWVTPWHLAGTYPTDVEDPGNHRKLYKYALIYANAHGAEHDDARRSWAGLLLGDGARWFGSPPTKVWGRNDLGSSDVTLTPEAVELLQQVKKFQPKLVFFNGCKSAHGWQVQDAEGKWTWEYAADVNRMFWALNTDIYMGWRNDVGSEASDNFAVAFFSSSKGTPVKQAVADALDKLPEEAQAEAKSLYQVFYNPRVNKDSYKIDQGR